MTFKKGQFLLVWAAASKQVWLGVGEETLGEDPLLRGGLSAGVPRLSNRPGKNRGVSRGLANSGLSIDFSESLLCLTKGSDSVPVIHLLPSFVH